MSRAAHKVLAGSGAVGAYEIEQSVMFNRGDDPYLSRTPSSAGNLRTWTLSWWMKRNDSLSGSISASQIIFGVGDLGASATPHSHNIYFRGDSADRLSFEQWSGSGTTSYGGTTRREFVDVAAWQHFVLIQDSTDGTAGDRFKIYVDGVRETDIPWGTALTSNWDGLINTTTAHFIGGSDPDGDNRHSMMQLAEMHFIDGTAKAASDFGEADEDTGQWLPKKYTGGSYGTNGFYLKFKSGAIGTDSSGQGNNWTTSNLANSDILLDTPTNNFCTWNGLHNGPNTLNQCNLQIVNSSGNADTGNTFAIPHTGKWYFEHRLTAVDAYYAGLLSTGYTGTVGSYSGYTPYQIRYDGQWYNGSAFESYASSFSNGDILGWAIDSDNGKIYVSVNGTFANSGNPASGTNPADTFTASADWMFITYGNADSQFEANFGQNGTFNGTVTAQGNADGNGIGDFYYSPPTGFVALCTKNLPEPAVKKSTEYFNTVLWTGDGNSAQSITGAGFSPDLTWLKMRTDAGYSHLIYDTVRGAGSGEALKANASSVEGENDNATNGYLDSFESDGFDVTKGSATTGFTNTLNKNYVSWNWKAGGSAGGAGTGGQNTDGNMANWNTVSTTAGFAIGAYTGTGGVKTVGHGLGKVPKCILVKCRSHDIDWCVYFGDSTDSLTLNDADARDDNDNRWNDTNPTSTVFTIYSSNEVNDSGKTYVYYAFAEIEGFSKFGQYKGTGSADYSGAFYHTGFRPGFVMIKRLDAGSMGWGMFDSKRSLNEVDELLYANNYDAEADSDSLYFLSNGFKISVTDNYLNNSSGAYFYMAFAEAPFKYANAR